MTEQRYGRLLDHVHLRVADLEQSARFYETVLRALDPMILVERGDYWVQADELFLSADGTPHPVHIAFQAEDEEAVRRFWEAGLAAGGADNGPPGERSYHPGYYAAYVLDPDGNNIEAVFHGGRLTEGPSELKSVVKP
ncbi:MAG TPA: VOC family protein [Thermoleophilia bacterium]|nr:VOC family protein [Thermoleophilia bacterium]